MLTLVQTERRPRLLIVDDIADNRAVLARRFARHGFDCVEANCGAKALTVIANEPFDAVLLDVMMPDMDGLEVLSRIRESRSAAALPVILVTALTASDDVVRGLSLGANDYLTKPVDFAVAHARVSVQVARKRAEDMLELLVDQLEAAIVTHLRQLKSEAAALANTRLEPAQSEIVENLKNSGSTFMRAVGRALRSARPEKAAEAAS